MGYDVLVVDDEKDIRDLICGTLQDERYKTRSASDGVQALIEIKSRQPNLVILDVWLGQGERDGIKILETIKLNHPFVPVIMISGHGTVETAVCAIKQGAYDFLEKPFATERLLISVERAIESARLRQENEELRTKSGIGTAIIGSSPAMTQARHLIEEASTNNARVLIQGAVGVGKQTTAREIHMKSQCHRGPFVILNSSSIHKDHIESELFGTDIVGLDLAHPRKIGALEKANGGTLYLSSIEHLPIPVQNRFNRFLQEGVFYRVGGQQAVRSDVRLIVSTLQDAKKLMMQDKILSDLFYRFGTIQISLPQLKDRATDIALLAKHFMCQIALGRGTMPKRFSKETMIILQSYNWPGQLNQLRHVVEWIIIHNDDHLSSHELITPELLPPEILSIVGMGISPVTRATSEIVIMPLKEARESFERDYLLSQIQRFEGNISQTARFVGMERSALHRKLKSLGVGELKHDEL